MGKEDFVNFLIESNIRFEKEENKVKIRGGVTYVSTEGIKEIVICQNETKIFFEYHGEIIRVIIDSKDTRIRERQLKNVYIYYSYPYLIVNF